MKNRGFTIIELLVVVAIIGVLSTVVLGSLSSARVKAKDAAVMSSISSYRNAAELEFNSGDYATLCGSDNYSKIETYVSNNGGQVETCEGDAIDYRIIAKLPSKNSIEEAALLKTSTVFATYEDSFCINSNGFAGKIDSELVVNVESPYCNSTEEAGSFGAYIYCFDHDDCLVYDGSGSYGIDRGVIAPGSGGGWSLTSSSLCTAPNSGATYMDCGGATR